jgi:hypothetical protein
MIDFLNRRPDFLIIGAQKAGTTALQQYLSQHPQMRCAREKEVRFFNRDKFYALGDSWYLRHFPYRLKPGLRLFEASPAYLYFPFVPDRIFRFDPQIKLIGILRNPVDRAFSAWNMYREIHGNPDAKQKIIAQYYVHANADMRSAMMELMNRSEFPDFHTSVTDEIKSLCDGGPRSLLPGYVQRGIYWEQVARYYAQFPKNHFLLVESTELKTDRKAVLNRVLGFLGLPEYDWHRADLGEQNARSYETPVADATRGLLQAFFQPHNRKLYSMIGQEFDW